MPSRKSKQVAWINSTDLEYAVGRLIAAGKTTRSEVARLAAERTARIRTLETELAALRKGKVMATVPVTPAPKKPAKAARKLVAVAAQKAGKTTTRSNGRKFTKTAKVVQARRDQGRYLGYLRQVPKNEKTRFQAIAKKDGVPVAVVALLKRLGKTGPAKTAAAVKPKGTPAKTVAPVAKPKKKAMPASYYRCAHPGCKNNWFVRGRPYCGEHAKLHGKAKSTK